MASASGPVPPCGLLDLQSLPSLERFDSRFLDIFRDSGNEAGAGGVPVMDELQAPDDDLALQRLMSLRNGQHKAAAVSRLQQYDFSEVPASNQHTSHSPDTPHAQPPHLQHHHHGSSSYTHLSSDPNQQHPSSSAMDNVPVSSAAAAAGGYDLNLNSSQLVAAHQYMMSQAAAAGGDGSVGFVPGSASGMQHMSMSMAAAMPVASEMMPLNGTTMHASSFAASASVPFGISGIDLSSLAAADCADPHSPLAGNLAGNLAFAGNADAGTPGGKRRSCGSRMADYIKAEQDGAALMMMDCDSGLASLLGEGAAALAGMGEQLHQLEMEEAAAARGGPSKRSRGSRGQAVAHDFGADSDFDGQEARAAALSITPDMDEDTRARIRREKNRVAARKCRAKKMAFMVELQKTLRELMRKNEEYRLQVITWHKMFSREVRLREAMKRIIAVMWQSGVAPAASGYTANDVIIGLESGTLDVNSLVRTLASLSTPPTHSNLSINTAAAAAEMANQVTAHTPSHAQQQQHAINALNSSNSPSHALTAAAPLVMGSPTAAAAAAAAAAGVGHVGAGSTSVPATPHAAAAASQLLALQQQQQQQQSDGLTAEVCGSMAGDRSAADVLPSLADGSTTGGTIAGGTVACSSPLSGEHTEATLPMSLLSAQYSQISNNSTAVGLPGGLAGASAHGSAVQMQIAMSKLAAAAGYGVMQGLPEMGDAAGAGAGAAVFAGLEGYVLGGGQGAAAAAAAAGPSCITTGAQE